MEISSAQYESLSIPIIMHDQTDPELHLRIARNNEWSVENRRAVNSD